MQLGSHLVIELRECDPAKLDDVKYIEETLVEAQKMLNTTILNVFSYKFQPQGVTCIVQIAESHISIHTWPELKYAQLDVFTCGKSDPLSVVGLLAKRFDQRYFEVSRTQRGVLGGGGTRQEVEHSGVPA